MKKITIFLLALAMLVGLCACGKESLNEDIERAVDSRISVEAFYKYDTNAHSITHNIREIGENEYEVTGRASVTGTDHVVYTGEYTAKAVYDPETDDVDLRAFSLGEMYR